MRWLQHLQSRVSTSSASQIAKAYPCTFLQLCWPQVHLEPLLLQQIRDCAAVYSFSEQEFMCQASFNT